MVASAVVGETISRVSSFLIDQPERKSSEKEKEDKERLEMAHIKMEAALHLSSKWQITELPMLRWRRKLKRAAQECDNTLRHCKQRALEDEEIRRRSSLPRRIAQVAKSYVSSFKSRSKADVDESSSNSSVDIRRLERFADGASEFLKMVEFGGIPGRQYMFFNPLIGDLLAGKTLRYQALQGRRLYNLGMRPTRFAERGVEAMVWFAIQDLKEPAKSMNLRFMLRLSESSDIFGIIIKCLRSATPHFMTAAEDCYAKLSDERKSQQGATQNGRRNTPNSGSALKLEVLFIPHDSPSPIGMEPAAESYALEVIDGKEQETVYKNASLQAVDEKLLPKAMDHLCQNSQSRTYQMCLMSRHGTAHLCVEKTTTQSRGRNKKVDKKPYENVAEGWQEASNDLLKFWVVRASDKLHGSVRSWIVNSPRGD
ncbi:unnamed protein product [Alopecurus aequalis]